VGKEPVRQTKQGQLQRLYESPAAWSWLFNGLRLGTALAILPLLLHSLTAEEMGVHFVLINMLVLLPALDAAVAFNLSRFVAHAMNGAQHLQAQGLCAPPAGTAPNYVLVWQLIDATRCLYRCFALIVVTVLAAYGYLVLSLRIEEVPQPATVWLALGLSIVGAACDIYWGYWGTFLKGMEQVLPAVRWQTAGYAIRLVLAAALLVAGLGLLSLPVAGLAGSLVQRLFTRRRCLRLLNPNRPRDRPGSVRTVLLALFPNSWRMGLQMLSQLVLVNGCSYLSVHQFGLATNASYGLSLQLFSIAATLSAVWSSVRWPTVNRLRFQHDFPALRALISQMFRRQTLTYLTLASLALVFAPTLLGMLGSDSSLLPLGLLVAVAVNQLLDLNFSFWTTLLAAENKIPSLWPTVASNLSALLVAATLIAVTNAGVSALILVPLSVGLIFNYWYWMIRGCLTLDIRAKHLGWARFLEN
jgi:hypothetical protein